MLKAILAPLDDIIVESVDIFFWRCWLKIQDSGYAITFWKLRNFLSPFEICDPQQQLVPWPPEDKSMP